MPFDDTTLGQLRALLTEASVLTAPEDLIPYSFDGTAFGQFTLNATGTGNIQTPQNSEAVVHLDKPAQVIMAVPGAAGDLGSIFLDSGDLVLIPLETEECSRG